MAPGLHECRGAAGASMVGEFRLEAFCTQHMCAPFVYRTAEASLSAPACCHLPIASFNGARSSGGP